MSYGLDHLLRMKRTVRETYSLSEAPRWITENTKIRGAKYSFKDHEFQLRIIEDVSRVVNVQKCSQVGLTEVMFRWALALTQIIPDLGIIITLPYSNDASEMARTRVDPMIENSPKLKALVGDLNNSEVKAIGSALMYFRGTNGKTQALSTPADVIVSDEIDRSDPALLSQYTSRLTHSRWKLRRNFSTPTIPGWGIAKEMETSRRFQNICKCNHCNHYFIPDYFQNVIIPGFDDDLRTISKNSLSRIRWQEAQFLCTRCGEEPSLQPEYREWVQENPQESHEAAGYYVSPFDAPNLISTLDLIKASTSYEKYSEFVNQNLGLTEQDEKESLTLADVQKLFVEKGVSLHSSSHIHCMGVDCGLIMHVMIGRLTGDGELLVVHRERVAVGEFEKRRVELARQYRVVMTVIDSQPFTTMVMQLQAQITNLFGAIYVESRSPITQEIKMFDGKVEDGKLPIHLAKINRNKALDQAMYMIKGRDSELGDRQLMLIQRQDDDLDQLTEDHFTDMKRVEELDRNGERHFVWKKSRDAQDHFWHALIYLISACKLLPASRTSGSVGSGVPLMSKFRVKSRV